MHNVFLWLTWNRSKSAVKDFPMMLCTGILRYTANNLVHLDPWFTHMLCLFAASSRRHLERCDNSSYRFKRRPRAHVGSPANRCGVTAIWTWSMIASHDDVIKWKHFPRYWPFVRGIHRSPVNSPHKGQWRRGLMFSLICAWVNDWVSNRDAGDLRRHRAHYDVIVMCTHFISMLSARL